MTWTVHCRSTEARKKQEHRQNYQRHLRGITRIGPKVHSWITKGGPEACWGHCCPKSQNVLKTLLPWPCGSVGWTVVPNTQRLQVRSLVGAGMGDSRWLFLLHIDASLSLLSSFSKTKPNQKTAFVLPGALAAAGTHRAVTDAESTVA